MRRTVVVLCAALLVVACSPMGPRRLKMVPGGWQVEEQAPQPTLSDVDVNPPSRSPQARSLGSSSWEHFESFDVGIIEFDEHGRLWSESQRDLVLANVRQHAMQTGATVIVYVHGWHHSARWNDTNLVSFRRVLRYMASQPTGVQCRPDPTKRSRVIGVFLGWRGESVPVPVANLFTIWSRKRIAQTIGGPATNYEEWKARRNHRESQFGEVLGALDKIHDEANQGAQEANRTFTSLVISGHSLGGAMILSAMQRIVFGTTLDRATVIAPANLNRLGDAVILLNPAVEARRYKAFRAELAGNMSQFSGAQKPILLTMSSTGDWPNRIALRVARFFPTLFTPGRWREWHDSTTALGFSKPDLSHSVVAPDNVLAIQIENAKISLFPDGIPPDVLMPEAINLAASRKFGVINLFNEKKINEYAPFMVASSNKNVIRDHNDIFSPGVISFVAPYVSASVRKNILQFCRTPQYQQTAVK